jgi:hypothetical protein
MKTMKSNLMIKIVLTHVYVQLYIPVQIVQLRLILVHHLHVIMVFVHPQLVEAFYVHAIKAGLELFAVH